MTTINAAQAWAAIKSRLEAAKAAGTVTVPLRFQNETTDEIDDNTAFAFVTFSVLNQYVASFGGGRGFTRMRNPSLLLIFLCTPKGWGNEDALLKAEEIAGVFRNQTFGGVSCFGASCDTSGLLQADRSEIPGNYDVTTISVDMRFDQLA